MSDHEVVNRQEWAAAREELLAREKEHTRLSDELARQRRELPWVRVEKEYRFETDEGTRKLAGLFDGRSQLLVYHFMFGPQLQGPARPALMPTPHPLTTSTSVRWAISFSNCSRSRSCAPFRRGR